MISLRHYLKTDGECKVGYQFAEIYIIELSMENYQFTTQIEKDKETGLYTGIVPNLPGAHTQGATLDELQQNLKEVIEFLEELPSEKNINK